MKTSIFIFLVTVLFLACSKEKETFQKTTLGTWELERRAFYDTTLVYPAGNGNLFILKDDGTYAYKKGDSLLKQGSYAIDYTNDCAGTKQHFFRAEGYSSHTLSIENEKLVFSTSNCLIDGGYSIYHKKDE